MNLQHIQKESSNLSSTLQHNFTLYQNHSLKIGSLNTRGLNDNTKLKCLLSYTVNNNYSIFELSETKIKESSQIHYKTDDSKAGVALVINRDLFKHHFKTTSYQGYII